MVTVPTIQLPDVRDEQQEPARTVSTAEVAARLRETLDRVGRSASLQVAELAKCLWPPQRRLHDVIAQMAPPDFRKMSQDLDRLSRRPETRFTFRHRRRAPRSCHVCVNAFLNRPREQADFR